MGMRSIAAGSRTLAWAIVLISVVSYAGAVLLTQTLGRDAGRDGFEAYREIHFSTVERSMFTLFRCFTGDFASFDGKPLGIALRTAYGSIVPLLYSTFVMAVTLGLFNVLVSILVQSTQSVSKFNEEERRKYTAIERRRVAKKTQQIVNRIWILFKRSVPGRKSLEEEPYDFSKGHITRTLFDHILQDAEVNALLTSLGMMKRSRMTLFDDLDANANGKLTFSDIVRGINWMGRSKHDRLEELRASIAAVTRRLVDLEGSLLYRCFFPDGDVEERTVSI